jgi:hypothetical protein
VGIEAHEAPFITTAFSAFNQAVQYPNCFQLFESRLDLVDQTLVGRNEPLPCMSQDVLEDYADTFRIRKAASKVKVTRSYQFLQVTALRAGRNINMMPPLGCTMLTNHFIIIPLEGFTHQPPTPPFRPTKKSTLLIINYTTTN